MPARPACCCRRCWRAGACTASCSNASRASMCCRASAPACSKARTVDVLRANGLAERMDREGHAHDGMRIVWAGRDSFLIDTHKVLGRRFMTYGQTQIQEDLFADADRRGQQLLEQVSDITLHGIDSASPSLRFSHQGEASDHRLRVHRRLRRFPRRVAQGHAAGRAARVREGLSLRLAGRDGARASAARRDLRQPSARLCAGLAPQRAARPLLHPGAAGRPRRGLARRSASGRSSRRASRRSWRRRSKKVRRSRSRSRRCAASWPSR